MLKILHIAPQNIAGVPYDYHRMHTLCGDYSRLITLHQDGRGFPEDVCLNLPLPQNVWARRWRNMKQQNINDVPLATAPVFSPNNSIERLYFFLGDAYRRHIANRCIRQYNLNDFDIVHFDGGLDFTRFPYQALQWKKMRKKIVCCYYGSDLRLRGTIKELDEISDLNITSEFDHLTLKDNLHYCFYPFFTDDIPQAQSISGMPIRIVHSPTNRQFKGTELIVSVVEKLQKKYSLEFLLLEGIPRNDVLNIKSECQISIDQVGGSMGGDGYGKSGLETLSMGIPTITNMSDEYNKWLPENPFVVANNAHELEAWLIRLIEDADLRKQQGDKGRTWVEKYHGYRSVNARLYELYESSGIIPANSQ